MYKSLGDGLKVIVATEGISGLALVSAHIRRRLVAVRFCLPCMAGQQLTDFDIYRIF
jgi:hypothetical protein